MGRSTPVIALDEKSRAAAEPAPRPRPAHRAPRGPAWTLWALPPLVLAVVVGTGVLLVRSSGQTLLGVVLGLLLVVPLLWIAASALWPAHAERTCPECGAERLERLEPGATVGLRCAACGWSDPERSAWYLAEEEGPLERIVLAERRRARRGASRSGTPPGEGLSSGSPVDSPGRED